MLPETLASGLRLDRTSAERAVAGVANPLALGLDTAAQGIIRIANAAMAGAIHEITIQQGHDPRVATLMPFGGAGPLFATLLAPELGISRIVVPPYPGNFSAWGMLGADLVRTASRTRVMPLDGEATEVADAVLTELFGELEERSGALGGRATHEAALDIRYQGQEHSLTVAVPLREGTISAEAAGLRERFVAEYARTFSYTLDVDPEIVNIRATLRQRLPRRRLRPCEPQADSTLGAPVGTRSAYSFTRKCWLDFDVISRTSISPSELLTGPAIVIEQTATTYLDAGFRLQVHPAGALVIHRLDI
jgi:N-methylhydantoinase A